MTARTRLRRLGPIAVAPVLLALGCGDARPVVTGLVRVDGRPAEGVYVVLQEADGPGVATDRTAADGSFSLVVEAPGEVVVNAFWPVARVTKEGDSVEEGDRLAGRYRDARNPVARLRVGDGRTALPPIELSRPPRGGEATDARARR
jgi:hypothetical protein